VRALVLVATLAAGAITAVVVVSPRPAYADEDDDKALVRAKKFHREGEKLFALGKFKQALVQYEKAYEAKPLPAFLFNIGQCHRNLDDYDAAIFSFRKYLKLAPDAPNRESVLEYIDELEREKERVEGQRLVGGGDTDLVRDDPDQRSGDATGRGDDRDDRQVRPGKPFYKKWWFWGGVALVGAGAVGTAVVLSGDSGPPATDLGNIDFGR
jgi:tetratricopeptide (TPR) repeat protein